MFLFLHTSSQRPGIWDRLVQALRRQPKPAPLPFVLPPEPEGTPWRGEMATNVAGRALWLDRVAPGWHQRVDLHMLDLQSTKRCVLGQIFRRKARWWGPYVSGFGYACTRWEDEVMNQRGAFAHPLATWYWQREIVTRQSRTAGSIGTAL